MNHIYYLTPTSFCRGVERSLELLDRMIADYPDRPLYCYHAIVHNPSITQSYRDRGIQFVESLDEIPTPDAVVAFSAHGISRKILSDAQSRFFAVYNLECPLVTKVYTEIDIFQKKGILHIIYIGSRTHQEGKNVVHWIESQGLSVHVTTDGSDIPDTFLSIPSLLLSQTTLNYDFVLTIVDRIKKICPLVHVPPVSDICKATRERQSVIKQYADRFSTIIVLGGKQSHNTRELVLLAESLGKRVLYEESWEDLFVTYNKDFLLADESVAMVAGASTPDTTLRACFAWYKEQGYKGHILSLDEKTYRYK